MDRGKAWPYVSWTNVLGAGKSNWLSIGYSRGFVLAATIGGSITGVCSDHGHRDVLRCYSRGFVLAATVGCSIARVLF